MTDAFTQLTLLVDGLMKKQENQGVAILSMMTLNSIRFEQLEKKMSFDAETFMGQARKAADSTEYPKVPDGQYDNGYIDKITPREKDGDVRLQVSWDIRDDDLKSEMERDKITVGQTVFLDTEEVDGQYIMLAGDGKNVGLGRLREALGLNDGSKNFQLSDLLGEGPCTVTVRTDKRDGRDYTNVVYVVGA